MIKTLVKSVREYKKPALVTPMFMILEALCECLIPFFMAQMLSAINVEGDLITTSSTVYRIIIAIITEVVALVFIFK